LKLKFLDRIAFFLGAVFVAAVGVAVIVISFQFSGIDLIDKDAAIFSLQRILLMVIGLISLGYGAFLLALPHKFTRSKRGFVSQKTENGELRIAIKAIEHLVQRCIDMHNEIKVVSMDINNNHDGVRVELRISLANNISIPLAVASLQKQIKQYLLASSGIDVREVGVSVETASSNVGESPYLVEDTITQPNGAAPPPNTENKKKKPLHQRIFSKEDQSAVMPLATEDAEPMPLSQTTPTVTYDSVEALSDKTVDDTLLPDNNGAGKANE
jgi:hypothetical protein